MRDLISALRVLDNPRDRLAWYRLFQMLEGVGPAGAHRAMTSIGLHGDGGTGASPLARFLDGDLPLPTRAAEDLAALRSALADSRACGAEPESGCGPQVDRLRQGLEPLIRRRYDHAELRLRDFDALSRVAGGFEDRARLVAELTLDPPRSTGDLAGPPHLDDDYVTLSTVHSAKGGEWRVVHVIHASDGRFPSDMATGSREGIEEERRLFYVALTRAREHLHLYAPLRYHHERTHGWADGHSYAQRSRFLPPSVDPLLDHRAVRSTPADAPMPVASVALPTAVDVAVRSLW